VTTAGGGDAALAALPAAPKTLVAPAPAAAAAEGDRTRAWDELLQAQ
jgi:hypothetical protein